MYWVALLVFSLRSALGVVARGLTAPGSHGSVGASFENGNFILKVTSDTQTYIGTTSFATIALWFAGPPLLLFLVWLATRRAPVTERDSERDYRIT